VSKQWKPGRETVEMRPSKIRRDPPAQPVVKQTMLPDSDEREAWTVGIGVLLFAIAIAIIILAVSDYTSG
jgi:hypothetical protein